MSDGAPKVVSPFLGDVRGQDGSAECWDGSRWVPQREWNEPVMIQRLEKSAIEFGCAPKRPETHPMTLLNILVAACAGLAQGVCVGVVLAVFL